MTEPLNTAAIPNAQPAPAPEAPKKHVWLPLLTVLFLISYGLMTMLIVEQGSTIESQRALIRELFRDSTELTAAKLKAQHDHAAGQRVPASKSQAQNSLTQAPMTQEPSTHIPSSQTPSTQIPSSNVQSEQSPSSQVSSPQSSAAQAAQQNSAKKPTQKQFRMPSKPASELIDDRRALVTI